MRWLGFEPKPEREERVIVAVPYIHRELVNPLEPGPGQLARESIITKQGIGHALSLAPWEPGSYEGIHLGDVLLDHQRSAGDDYHDAPDGFADVLDHCRTRSW